MWLELEQVVQRYGGDSVLDGLDLSLAEGEIGCLIGASGCGKTTVLRTIAGFEPIESGRIRVAGETLSEGGRSVPPERRKIAVVFQEHALFPHLDAAGNIAFGLSDEGSGTRVAELLERVGLAGMGDRYPHQLSGGQRQRVALARALAPSPRLLLLDEPFASLDVDLRQRLSLEIRELLRDTGTTALLVTHDQGEAFAMADRIGLMRGGRVAQWDTAYNLYHRPRSREVAEFVGQGVFLPGVVEPEGTVRIAAGRLQGRVATEHQPGTEIDVLLRPDDITHEDASALTAVVRRKVFRGADILYTLELDSGERVLSLVPSHHNHHVGEAIGIRLEVDHIVAFPRLATP